MPLGKGLSLEVEGQMKSRFSMGGAFDLFVLSTKEFISKTTRLSFPDLIGESRKDTGCPLTPCGHDGLFLCVLTKDSISNSLKGRTH